MDALETQLLIQQSQVKSPGFAAVFGFFFPALAALYVRRFGLAMGFVALDLFFLVLSIVGIGLVLLVLYRFYAAYQGQKWAREINQRSLKALIDQRNSGATV